VRVPARSEADAPALVLDGVTVRAPGGPPGEMRRALVRDVDWRVEPGEHWAVLGANGAGKTTLLRTAAGALDPPVGTVDVLGEPLSATGLRDPRLGIGVIEARPRPFAGHLTATEVVVLRRSGPAALLGAKADAADAAHAHELLVQLGCGALLNRRYADCSEGERQRILLARTLMRDPALLLLDEPTAALDLAGREGFLDAMVRLAAERPKLATLTVTHHLEELPGSTTHALLLRDGRVVGQGPLEATFTEERLTACFGVPVSLGRFGDRWVVRAA
jgi:iron complex transport system ATP-binding protein